MDLTKFRGRIKNGERWVYGDFARIKGIPCIIPECGGTEKIHIETLGQYIGVRDDYDREVYKGHIVALDTEDGISICEVAWGKSESIDGMEETLLLSGHYLKHLRYEDYEDHEEESIGIKIVGDIYDRN